MNKLTSINIIAISALFIFFMRFIYSLAKRKSLVLTGSISSEYLISSVSFRTACLLLSINVYTTVKIVIAIPKTPNNSEYL